MKKALFVILAGLFLIISCGKDSLTEPGLSVSAEKRVSTVYFLRHHNVGVSRNLLFTNDSPDTNITSNINGWYNADSLYGFKKTDSSWQIIALWHGYFGGQDIIDTFGTVKRDSLLRYWMK